MLTQVAEGVLIHESEFCQSNAVVVQGGAGVSATCTQGNCAACASEASANTLDQGCE